MTGIIQWRNPGLKGWILDRAKYGGEKVRHEKKEAESQNLGYLIRAIFSGGIYAPGGKRGCQAKDSQLEGPEFQFRDNFRRRTLHQRDLTNQRSLPKRTRDSLSRVTLSG